MRSFLAPTLLIALAATFAGCAATESDRRLAFWKTPLTTTKAEEQKEASPESTAKSDNPFRKAADAAAPAPDSVKSSETKVASNNDGDNPSKTETAAAIGGDKGAAEKSGKAGAFHPETMKIIDAELADASPDERAYWYDQLKRVDPAVIPQILQARRLTAQIVEQRQQESSQSGLTADDSSRPFPDQSSNPVMEAKTPGGPNALIRQSSNREPDRSPTDQPSASRESDRSSWPQGTQIASRASEPAAEKSRYAVQRVTGTDASPAASAPSTSASSLLPSFASSRNALNRFLPGTRSGGSTESAANAPSAISLLPPTDLDPTGSWQQQLDPLISMMEAEVAQLKPGTTEETQTEYIERHVYLRLLYLMAQHPERALTAIPGIDSADQEFWQQMLWAMTNYFDAEHLPAAKDRAGQAVAQLATATQRLRERSDLEIRNLAFCREIAYFGNFVRFPRDEFHPGDSALLYAEIENFKSELTVEGEYRTLIRSTMEILSPSGEVRWHKEFQAEEDLCINYRRDYFHNYRFAIPDSLPLGPHSLKLTVFDELSGKMVSQSINFVVR